MSALLELAHTAWQCKRCGEDVDYDAMRCGCDIGPSPWEPKHRARCTCRACDFRRRVDSIIAETRAKIAAAFAGRPKIKAALRSRAAMSPHTQVAGGGE